MRRADQAVMLIGDKVCLGPVLNGDVPLLFAWLDNPDVAGANGPYRPASEAKFHQWVTSAATDCTRVLFVIRKKADLRLLGHLHISNIQTAMRSADIGLAIGPPADRGHGYGPDALRLAVGYCWRELNLERVALTVLGNNPWARHVYEKAGFEVEGRLRRATYVDGQFHDVTVMAMLRPDTGPQGASASAVDG
ncbi:MAG TPA: GNAT family protein [Caulobacteraceae bacterium]|jgi:RimJ/RimL family protein N-acetyltransferase